MATFLKLVSPTTFASFVVLNVSGFHEDPMEFQGEARPSFKGNLLSTQRDPHRIWRCTAEFLTLAAYEAFRTFCSSGVDASTGRLAGLRAIRMVSEGADGAVPLAPTAFGLGVMVYPTIGAATAFEYAEGGQYIQGRSVELSFREV